MIMRIAMEDDTDKTTETDALLKQLISDTELHVADGLITEEEGEQRIADLKARLSSKPI
jgi:hypothetical protein